tara:strand:- start:949 stop:1164 length:216 start_codon:yes stop_codon:yes gene_type:complete
MRFLLLLFVYFFSTIVFANHCNSGASHNGPDRQADQKGYLDSKETEVIEEKAKNGPSESINITDEDGELNS